MFRWKKTLANNTTDHVTVSDETPMPVSLRSNVYQQESITFTAACTVAGNLTFDITSARAGCTQTLTIPVTTADDSVEKVAVKVRAAILAASTLGAVYDVAGGTGIVMLTAKVPCANDATLAMALTRAGATGVTAGSFVDTTGGTAKAGTAQVETITFTAGCTANGTLTFGIVSGIAGCTATHLVPITTTASTPTLAAAVVEAYLLGSTSGGAVALRENYTIGGGAVATVTLTAKVKTTNDTSLAMALTSAGTGVTVSASVDTLTGVLGVLQVETIEVTAGASGAGNVTWTVTSPLLTAGARALTVALLETDTTVEAVAAKLRNAMTLDNAAGGVGYHYTMGGAPGFVSMTAKVKAADVAGAGVQMARTSAGTTGITVGASTDTTAGVAHVHQIETITVTAGAGQGGNIVFGVRAAAIASGVRQDFTIPLPSGRTVNQVAEAIIAYLNTSAGAAVTAVYTVGGTGATVTLTRIAEAADDGLLAMSLVSSGTGCTVGSTTKTTAGALPVVQIGTITVTHKADNDGTIAFGVISAITGCAKTLSVAVLSTDDSVTKVGDKIRAALTADTTIAANYTVGGAAGAVSLTAKVAAANDGTLSMALSSAGATGVTANASLNTTLGVDPLSVTATISGIPSVSLSAGTSDLTTIQSAINATADGSSVTCTGLSTVVFQITGAFVATVSFEGSVDGTTWTSQFCTKLGDGIIANTATATGSYRASVAGLQLVRARVTWVSGTSITIKARTSSVDSSNKSVALGAGTCQPSATFAKTNSADAYTALDVVGPAVTANLQFDNVSATPGSQVIILGANMRAATNAVPATMGTFRLHIYNAAPTALADNAAYNLIDADVPKYQGYLTIGTPIDLGDNIWGQSDGVNLACKLAAGSTTFYGVLQTVAAFTPVNAATSKTITLNVVPA